MRPKALIGQQHSLHMNHISNPSFCSEILKTYFFHSIFKTFPCDIHTCMIILLLRCRCYVHCVWSDQWDHSQAQVNLIWQTPSFYFLISCRYANTLGNVNHCSIVKLLCRLLYMTPRETCFNFQIYFSL